MQPATFTIHFCLGFLLKSSDFGCNPQQTYREKRKADGLNHLTSDATRNAYNSAIKTEISLNHLTSDATRNLPYTSPPNNTSLNHLTSDATRN